MRVLHVVNGLSLGGTEKAACLLARWCQLRGHEAKFVYLDGGERVGWADELLGKDNLMWGAGPRGQLLGIIKAVDPDITHVHRGIVEYPSPTEIRDACPKTKVVLHHVFGAFEADADVNVWVSAEMVARGAASLGWDLTKVAVLPNPVRPAHVLSTLDLPGIERDETLVVGSMGRPDDAIFDPTHLQALAVYMARKPDRKVLYIRMGASDSEKATLKQLAIPHVLVEPTVSDGVISRFLNTLDFYLHARRDGESDGMCLSEALAHGKRFITHEGGHFRAHVQKAIEWGGFARCVGAYDVTAYADAIAEFDRDDYSKRIALDLLPGRAMARYGIEVIGDAVLREYERLLA